MTYKEKLAQAIRIVASWPKWKQTVLGGESVEEKQPVSRESIQEAIKLLRDELHIHVWEHLDTDMEALSLLASELARLREENAMQWERIYLLVGEILNKSKNLLIERKAHNEAKVEIARLKVELELARAEAALKINTTAPENVQERVEYLEKALIEQEHHISTVLGTALYGLDEETGNPLWGEHTAETLATKAVHEMWRLEGEIHVRNEALLIMTETSIRSDRKIKHCAGYLQNRICAALAEARKRVESEGGIACPTLTRLAPSVAALESPTPTHWTERAPSGMNVRV